MHLFYNVLNFFDAILLSLVLLGEEEKVLDGHSLFYFFNLEVISVSCPVNFLLKLFVIILLMYVREDLTNLEDGHESTDLT